MEPRRWHRIKEVVSTALDTEDPRQWPQLLADCCGNDLDLFFEATGLLATTREIGDFIEKPICRLNASNLGPATVAPALWSAG